MKKLNVENCHLLTAEETAGLIGVSRQLLAAMTQRGEIQALQAGRRRYYTGAAIKRWAGLGVSE